MRDKVRLSSRSKEHTDCGKLMAVAAHPRILRYAGKLSLPSPFRARRGLTPIPRVNPGMCSAPYGPREFGCFQSVARSGQESIAQGLPWVIPPTRISPEGATRYGENRLRTFERDRMLVSSPFRAKRIFLLTQGKPGVNPIGANLFCYNIFEPGFCGTWKIPKGRTPAVANRRSSLPDSIQAPPPVGFDGE
jgi:hypothetical protein